MRSSPPRGSLLIGALLLASIVLLVGLGFLSKRRAQYQATLSQRNELMALALAEAGLEDARLKLLKDHSFPPYHDGQNSFSYRENLGGGSYEVQIHRYFGTDDSELVVIESRGAAGPPERPDARRWLQAEMDRGRIHSYKDLGSY